MAFKSCGPKDFEALVEMHENRLYRAALAIMGNTADAEDVVQEAFLRAYEKAPEFETREHEKAWLMKVTVNLCHSRLRSPWRRRMEPLLETYPAKECEQHGIMELVLGLPSKYRTVIHLFYYEDCSVKDIAELTGQKEGTVKSLLTRARQKLKLIMKEGDKDENL